MMRQAAVMDSLGIHLDERSKELRRMMIAILAAGQRGHLPSAFSLTEILRVLYDHVLRYDPQNPTLADRDRFILSKGHGCIALYTLLAEKGFFPKEDLLQFCAFNSHLGGHPETHTPGVEWSTGSLGHGLPVGIGFALNARLLGKTYRTYVVIGDGESNEGSIWEGALAAAKHQLDNLVVITDYNKVQSCGKTSEILELEPLAEKWASFGFAVRQVNGHDVLALQRIFQQVPFENGKPNMVICHTVKGKGVAPIENNLSWHHKTKLEEKELSMLHAELERYP